MQQIKKRLLGIIVQQANSSARLYRKKRAPWFYGTASKSGLRLALRSKVRIVSSLTVPTCIRDCFIHLFDGSFHQGAACEATEHLIRAECFGE